MKTRGHFHTTLSQSNWTRANLRLLQWLDLRYGDISATKDESVALFQLTQITAQMSLRFVNVQAVVHESKVN